MMFLVVEVVTMMQLLVMHCSLAQVAMQTPALIVDDCRGRGQEAWTLTDRMAQFRMDVILCVCPGGCGY